MGNLSNYISVLISRNSVGPTLQNFDTALILTPNAWATAERTRTYSDLAAVAVDFPTTTSAEYRAANALFAQNPAPQKVKFGKLLLKPTLVYTLSAVTPTANVSYTYSVRVRGKGITDTTVTFASDASPTDAEYASGMVTALNAVASKNYTAAGASSPITITATAAGDWFTIEPVDPTTQTVTMTHVDPGVATDLAAIKLADPGFYMIYNMFNSAAMGTAIAAWAEANGRYFMADTCDMKTITTAVTNGEFADAMKTLAYTRTACQYHDYPSQMIGCALMAKCMTLLPGTESWEGKTLTGITPSALTDTHRANLIARYCNGYESVAGIGITFDGRSASGDFIDSIRGIDAFSDDAQKAIFTAKLNSSKIGMNDPGIAKVENELRGSLQRFTVDADGIGLFNTGWSITVPKASAISSTDRGTRTLNGIKAYAQLAGAAHRINIAINVVS